MSRCVKYHNNSNHKPGQGVGVGFFHICHSVKMRQKHLGLRESSRGPPDHVQTDTCLVSDHTYRWGPFVINDFSNLTNSMSPTPEL